MAEREEPLATLVSEVHSIRRILDDRAEDGRHLAALLKAERRLVAARFDALGRQVDDVGARIATIEDAVVSLTRRIDGLPRAVAEAARRATPPEGGVDG